MTDDGGGVEVRHNEFLHFHFSAIISRLNPEPLLFFLNK
jgi:hypothetical protein